MAGGITRPRMLVTGFGPFPGAPENPTEALIDHLQARPPVIAADVRLCVLPVDYGAIDAVLAAEASACEPDIAVHFGLAQGAAGFRLEDVARNEIAAGRPDAGGCQPEKTVIGDGPAEIVSGLPLDLIERRLRDASLPVERSRNAGGYLCNYVFYQSCGARLTDLAPAMAGFVHVPWTDTLRDRHAPEAPAISFGELTAGAEIVLAACVEVFLSRSPSR